MSRTSAPLIIRVSQEHKDALDKLPSPLTASTLIRALIQEYLAGSLPSWVDAKILAESVRSTEARRNGHFKPGYKPWNSATERTKTCQSNPKGIPPILKLNLPKDQK